MLQFHLRLRPVHDEGLTVYHAIRSLFFANRLSEEEYQESVINISNHTPISEFQ